MATSFRRVIGAWLRCRAMLKLVLPKGSLEKATLELFEAADLRVHRDSAVTYKATIDDPRVDEVRILRPQEIPTYVAEGLFDLGITGRDWVEETSARSSASGELQYSKATANPVRIIVAVPGDSPWQPVADLPQGVRVSSEYPALTKRLLRRAGDRGRHPPVLRRHRGQGARHRRLHRRPHRDRPGPAGRRPADHRHHAHLLHRADRQPGRLRRSRQGARHAPAPHPARGRARGPGQGAGQAQRAGRPARRGDRPAAVDEVARRSTSSTPARATRSRRWCPSRPSTC